MIRNLTGIVQPIDSDFIWKYMNLEKFVSLLDTRSLFFTRADKFEDPYEGFTPPSVTEYYKHTIDNIVTFEMFQENWHKYTYVHLLICLTCYCSSPCTYAKYSQESFRICVVKISNILH